MAEHLLAQGLELALLGMGTVFAFLTLLVFATLGMSALVQRLAPQDVVLQALPVATVADDAELVAVISAAISRHRRLRDEDRGPHV